MKLEIKPSLRLKLFIDGKEVSGDFKVVGEWEGLVQLECTGPCAKVIIHKPHIANLNVYDFLPSMFGGNHKGSQFATVEAEIVSQDIIREIRKKD